MSTLLGVNWPDFFAYLSSAVIVVLILLLFAYVQLCRHRIHRIRRGFRDAVQDQRNVPPTSLRADRLQGYVENAACSNDGSPCSCRTDRFVERRA